MTNRTASLADRYKELLATAPAPVTVLTGPCGSGRTEILLQLRSLLGPASCQYINIERIATTPERFLSALVSDSPFQGPLPDASQSHAPREAFDAGLAFLSSACTRDGRPATFLLDEVLDLRTFESFPGLRSAMPDLVGALESSPNRFVFATRFTHRATRMVDASSNRLALVALPLMTATEIREVLAGQLNGLGSGMAEDLARSVHALTDGRPAYVADIVAVLGNMGVSAADPVGAFVSLLASPSTLWGRCRFSYELRLHRARGYGALKAILDVLAEEEPLSLTAIAQRMHRTPGSTKDYLGWLEDVDLICADRKRYRISDPVLRLWIRLNGRSVPATEDLVAREVQRYAMLRLAAAARVEATQTTQVSPVPDTVPALVGSAQPADPLLRVRSSGIVEFD
ncbi:MAG: hypothetical protein AB7I50_23040 [Vicinamibacterales bacterium]